MTASMGNGSANGHANGHAAPAAAPATAAYIDQIPERPKDVGILAIEMYFPRRVRPASPFYSKQLT